MLLVLSSFLWAFPASASHSMRTVSSTRVAEEGGLGRVEVRKSLAAVLQKDEGVIAMVDVGNPRRPKVLGRYDDGATQSLDGDVAFSSDGRFVIYTSEQDGNPDIFRMRADGSEKVTSRNTRARTAIPASRPTAGGSSSTATEPATRRASRAAPWSATRITRSSR